MAKSKQAVKNEMESAQKALSISDVALREHHAKLNQELAAEVLDDSSKSKGRILLMVTPMSLNHVEENSSKKNKDEFVTFKHRYGVRVVVDDVVAKSKEPKVVLEIEATYDAIYKVADKTIKLTENCLKSFGEKNVPFNVWPFWREHVYSTMQRMHLQAISLPLYFMDPNGNK